MGDDLAAGIQRRRRQRPERRLVFGQQCLLAGTLAPQAAPEAAAPWDPGLRVPIGWVESAAEAAAPALHAGDRSLNGEERRRVRRVGQCLECHPGVSRIFDDFDAGLAAVRGEQPHPRVRTTRPAP